MIMIDAPPMIHLADARLLGRFADGVILGGSAGQTTTKARYSPVSVSPKTNARARHRAKQLGSKDQPRLRLRKYGQLPGVCRTVGQKVSSFGQELRISLSLH